jgi:hypothetical protein
MGLFFAKLMKCWRYHDPLYSNPSVQILSGCIKPASCGTWFVLAFQVFAIFQGVKPWADGMTRLQS